MFTLAALPACSDDDGTGASNPSNHHPGAPDAIGGSDTIGGSDAIGGTDTTGGSDTHNNPADADDLDTSTPHDIDSPDTHSPDTHSPDTHSPDTHSPDADTCDPACTPGATRCDTGGAQTCVSIDGCARWSDPVACSGNQVCSNGSCVDQCSDICTAGARECTGEKYRVCETNSSGCLDWSQPTACPAGEACSGGQCATTCTDACTQGATRCDNQATIQSCELQANGCLDWSQARTCPNQGSCVGNQCVGCTTGARRCDARGEKIEECFDNQWATVQACPLGCQGAACQTQTSCQPGSYQCNGNVVEVCNASGSAYLHVATCANGCSAGLCTGQCTPGARRCNQDKTEVCNTNGTAWTVDETCAHRCEPSIAACAVQSLEVTANRDLDGTIVVDGPVLIRSGAQLHSPSGDLTIIAQSITIEEGGSIIVAATGDYSDSKGRDSTTSTRGASGGGYGSRGGDSYGYSGAPARATDNDIEVTPGSRGGHGGGQVLSPPVSAAGGLGGGVLHLRAQLIDIKGSIKARGANGQLAQSSSCYGHGGSGSGGGVSVAADSISFSGTIDLSGGAKVETTRCPNSIYHGGEGGNGVVKFLYATSFTNTGSVNGVAFSGLLAPWPIQSSTHPDAGLYYNDDFDSIALSWERPFPTLQGYYHAINTTKSRVPTSANATFLDSEVTTYPRSALVDGVNYFHIAAIDREFNTGTMEARREVLINTKPPTLSSGSHANQAAWSTNRNANIKWTDQRPDINFAGYYYVVDQFGDTVPTKTDTRVPVTQKQTILSNLPDGIWAFHIVPVDTMGYLTKTASTYRVRIGDDPGTATIIGTVRDQNNNTISGATITINRGLLNPTTADQTTNSSGNYNFTNAPVGQWELRATHPGFKTRYLTVTLTSGGSHSADFTLEPR